MQDKKKTGFIAKIDSFFGISQKGSSFKIEITAGIGVGIVSYVVLSILIYLVDLIKYDINKTEKPKLELSIFIIIVFGLFLVYFLTK